MGNVAIHAKRAEEDEAADGEEGFAWSGAA